MSKLPKQVAAALASLAKAGLVETLSDERAIAAGFHELGARATKEKVLAHAHQRELRLDILQRVTRCTAKPQAHCPHGAMAVDYDLAADMNDDAGTFPELRALLEHAGIPLQVDVEVVADFLVRVSHGPWSVSASIDVDGSVAALVLLLNLGCAHVGTDRRFVHVHTKKLSTHVIVLRSPSEIEALRGVFRNV